MSKFRKLFSVLLSVAMLLSMTALPITTHAQDEIEISISDYTVSEGEEFVVSLNITPNANIGVLDVKISFDKTKLQYVSYANGPASLGGMLVYNPTHESSSGDTQVGYMSFIHATGANTGGSMLNVTFKVLSGWTGSTPLGLELVDICDPGFGDLTYILTSGKATVKAPADPVTLSFDSDGGTAVDDLVGFPGDPVTPPAPPTKPGFNFFNWNPPLPAEFPDADATFTAIWSRAEAKLSLTEGSGFAGDVVEIQAVIPVNLFLAAANFDVAFDNTKLEFVSAEAGSLIGGGIFSSNLANPTTVKIGLAVDGGILAAGDIAVLKFKILSGWTGDTPLTIYTIDTFVDDNYEFLDVITEDGKITSKSAPTGTINFDTAGGTPIAPMTGNVGAPVTPPADPTKEGFVFKGWEPDIPTTYPAGSITVVAQWNPVTKITFDTKGGSAIAPISGEAGTAVTAPADPVKPGYTFNGWEPGIPTTFPDENMTVVAKWTKDAVLFTVSSASGILGDTVEITVSVSANSDIAAADLFVAFNNTKLEYVSGAAGDAVGAGTISSINPQPAVGDTTEIMQALASDPVITAGGSLMVLKFKILDGWYGVTPLTLTVGQIVDEFYETMDYGISNGSITCQSSTITFDTDGGSAIAPITGAVGSSVTAPAEPTKEGFTFAGWDPDIPATFPPDDLTVVAQWTPIPKTTITFWLEEDSPAPYASLTGNVGSDVTPPADPTKEGNTFLGWDPDVPPTFPAEDLDVVAQWQVNSYNLTFDANGGEGGTGPTLTEFGAAITAPVVTRYGYTFVGWDPEVPATMPAADSTYVALWEEIGKTTITFDTDGGNTIDPITGYIGSPVTAPADPTKEGNTFVSWAPEIPDTFPADDLTVVAQWQVNTYKLTFDANGGEGGTGPTDTAFGAEITAPVVTRYGYTFTGWEPEVPATMPAADSTYTAQWQALPQTTITFDTDGGNTIDPITGYVGYPVTAPADPTKEGNTFTGWEPEIPANFPADDLTVVAQWQVNTYKLTFDANGGVGGTGPTDTAFGAEITAPVVTRYGYTFTGWEPEVPATMPAADSTYTAQWQELPKTTITFDTDGGNTIDPITGYVGYPVTAPADPTKEGNTFTGWEPEIPAAFPADDLTVKAQWQVNTYKLTFDANGGVGGTGPTDVEFGAAITAPTVTREGYTFTGWEPEVPATMPAADSTYTAQWQELPKTTITFDTDGGSTIDPITGYVGSPVTAPADPTKEGNTFTGWEPEIPAAFPADDLTVKAQWQVNTYKLTFDANGGVGGTGPTDVEFGAAITAPTVTREGYTFAGWTPDVPATMPAADSVYTAQWTVNSYNLTFDANGGEGGTGPTLTEFGAAITAPTVTREGYTFTGWTPDVPATMPAADSVYTAQWAVNSYNLTFDANGGEGGTGPTLTEFGAAITAPTVTREGYNFVRWEPDVPATMPAADSTYTAVWEAIPTSTITFDTDGGSAIDPITGYVGSPVTAPADPVKEGFTFAGWEPAIPDTFPNDDLTVKAKWEAVPTSTITFDTDGGSAIDPITGYVGSPVTAPADPVKEGFTFKGWEPEIPENFPAEDLTVVAQWEEILTSTITFDTDGGNEIDPITGEVGTPVTAPEDPVKEGFTFVGWEPEIPETFPAEDLTVKAMWEEDIPESTITFLVDGEEYAVITGEVGSAVTMPADPEKEGYTFIGWDPEVPGTFPEEDLTVEAVFEEIVPDKESTIKFIVDGEEYAAITGKVGSAVTMPADPEKEGYSFLGWEPEVPGTFPEEDLTVVAQWEKKADVPDTGSDNALGLTVFALFSAAAAAAFVTRKKKED
jgi:LPXTG-motif cell wall-anchored protein